MLIWLSGVTLALMIGGSDSKTCRQIDDAMLGMAFQDFDQGDLGWRSLEAPGCEAVAADGIKRYREQNGGALEDNSGLIWHEAQLRASAGQTDEALELMVRKRETDLSSIRPYTDPSIAFLRQDKAALLAAREALVAMPEPDEYRQAADRYAKTYPDLPPLSWPLNLDVVDGLIACFGRPYVEAYDCR